jgi:two-component system nitrate/nitrite response regulator NarL
MNPPITIVLADDHAILRKGLRLIIEHHPAFRIVGEASNGAEALALVQQHVPQVLLCDISMPVKNGIEVAQALRELNLSTHMLFLTMQDKEEYLIEAMRLGVRGFLPKDTVEDELVEAIERVAAGEEYYSKLIHAKAFAALRKLHQEPLIRLTPREKEILRMLASGLNSKMIANELSVSEYTVSNHRINLLRKFSAANVAELIRKASELSML